MDDFREFGYFLNMDSSNIKILIWIWGDDVSNKFNIGFFRKMKNS